MSADVEMVPPVCTQIAQITHLLKTFSMNIQVFSPTLSYRSGQCMHSTYIVHSSSAKHCAWGNVHVWGTFDMAPKQWLN